MKNCHNTSSTKISLLALLFMIGSIAGCKTVGTSVPVHGKSEEIALLAGSWRGEYESVETGRHGFIAFNLAAQSDSAFGYVMMQPGQPEKGFFDDFESGFNNSSDLLTIKFVTFGMGHIVGRLDNYTDPACGCSLETTFEGHMKGEDRIEGVYISHGEGFHIDARGRWSVDRIAKPQVAVTKGQ